MPAAVLPCGLWFPIPLIMVSGKQAAVQTESALTSIKVCFVWIPILVYVCGLVIMKFYHLDKEFDGIIADLKARAQK